MDAQLTVIMSCYNQAKYIRQAIDSVLMQKTDFPFRLFITDDCSTKDDSRAIIQEYAEKHPDRITALLNDTNGRYLANILRAKSQTKTEYLTLLDADDYWTDPGYLQRAVDFLRQHADYAIYFQNVRCCKEDGAEYLFLPEKFDKYDFTFEDYISGRILIPQTTGAVFRNVIYGKRIPPIVAAAVGTIHERSFEGDADRFLMHLAEGRAHYEPIIAGVYRILSSGIWCRLPDSEKHLIQAQCYLDYAAYFNRSKSFFARGAARELKQALTSVVKELATGVAPSPAWSAYFASVSAACAADCKINGLAESGVPASAKLKDRLCHKLYQRLRARLTRKGLL